MEFGILIPIIAILMGPVMYMIYLKELRLKQSLKLEDRGAGRQDNRLAELEQRVRVLERIVTDAGVQTAAQIEALREPQVAAPVAEKVW
jgi:hypothetical protein